MASNTHIETDQTRYLLGELSERERERLEAAYFTDEEAFDQMLVAENELYDAYVRGELPAAARARFEANLLTEPRGRERVKFARALAEAATAARPAPVLPEPAPAPPSLFAALRACGAGLRFALAAAVLVIAISLPWLLFERAQTHAELRQLRAEQATLTARAQESEQRAAAEQARREELLAQLAGQPTPPAPALVQPGGDAAPALRPMPPPQAVKAAPRASVLSFALTPGLVRGGGASPLRVPADASAIRLRLNVEASAYNNYRAVIETAGGREVRRVDALKPAGAGGTLTLPTLPARDLPPGDYILLLTGQRPDGDFEGVADYSFRIVRKQ